MLDGCKVASVISERLLLQLCSQVHDHEEYNPCVVGEDVAVEVTFRNPLQVSALADVGSRQADFVPP